MSHAVRGQTGQKDIVTTAHYGDGLHDAVMVHSTKKCPCYNTAKEAWYKLIYVNLSHFIFAELSLAEQPDELAEFERADINVSVISQGFKCELQCAKKLKSVAD